ncbi:ATP-binding protein [Janibacter sp. GXQ6167]|uniref:HAMP domain-containing sensor histidine kinase n=1 Tax=Janibacter sp. GXQ6167 TaxID=3240791 RepID=UPI0035237390
MIRTRRSLTTKLLASVIALFIAVTLITGTATVLVMQRTLTSQVDTQLTQQVDLLRGPDRDDEHDDDHPEIDAMTPRPCAQGGPGRGEGTVVACFNGTRASGYVVARNERVPLDATTLGAVSSAEIGPRPSEAHLKDLGEYRMMATRTSDGTVVVTGLPMEQTHDAVRTLLVVVVGAALVGLLLVLGVGSWLIRRNLLPLRRVAATAEKVSTLELDSGDVALVERVAPADADGNTEVGQVGRALNSMLDNVGGALTARHKSEMRVRQFVADASHELRTPLASIRGYAELSRREPAPVPPSVTHALARVESEALRMQGLVEDLLLLARLDAGRPLDREPVDLTMLAMTAVGDAHAAAPGHRWLLDLPDDPIEVIGDRARLTQVLVNLLANARTHTPEGTSVTTALHREGGDVVLSVTDDGPGVPEALQGEVFQRFTRGDESRQRASGSTGLGLSIVESVATAHGGQVTLRSEPGHTTFAVRLPA